MITSEMSIIQLIESSIHLQKLTNLYHANPDALKYIIELEFDHEIQNPHIKEAIQLFLDNINYTEVGKIYKQNHPELLQKTNIKTLTSTL